MYNEIIPYNDLNSVEQVKKYLSESDCFYVNMYMIQDHGPINAIYFAYIAEYYEEEWSAFPLMEHQPQEIGLSIAKIRKCKKYLIDQKIIEVKFMGVPPRQYFKVNPHYLTW